MDGFEHPDNVIPHTFTPGQEDAALQILESVQTAHEAAFFLLQETERKTNGQFSNVLGLLMDMLSTIQRSSVPYHERLKAIKLPLACQSMKASLEAIYALRQKDVKKCRMKIQFELLPALENAYMEFYFWAYVHTHPDREEKYYKEEIRELACNPYIDQAETTGQYKYDVSFMVLAYNNLNYTKMCVESLLRNIPDGLNYELILWDNGSSDGTTAYFESKKPDKLLESRINWSVGNLAARVFEGRYCFSISNDVVIFPNAIENMLKCIRSDERIAWVVPATSNISNLQAPVISMQYKSDEEVISFARENNQPDPFRWEQRVRLCDPISLCRAPVFLSRKGLNPGGYLTDNPFSFPDDRGSLLLRRSDYKMMLAKDAFCWHFGSVTLKNEIARQNTSRFYLEGRREFNKIFGVDPWGTGFCYDPAFLNRVVGDEQGHVDVLGINCGLGSNSLKIKEQIKEYCHNTDTYLCNITDDSTFLADLRGVSDKAEVVAKLKVFGTILEARTWQYIVWETPFLLRYKFKTLLNRCMQALSSDGKLILKLTDQNRSTITQSNYPRQELENDWMILWNEVSE